MRVFRQSEQKLPEAKPVTDGVVMRIEHIYEVDPDLMGKHFKQQNMPNWDVERLVASRGEHLDWMHHHFADEVLTAGESSEIDSGPGN